MEMVFVMEQCGTFRLMEREFVPMFLLFHMFHYKFMYIYTQRHLFI